MEDETNSRQVAILTVQGQTLSGSDPEAGDISTFLILPHQFSSRA